MPYKAKIKDIERQIVINEEALKKLSSAGLQDEEKYKNIKGNVIDLRTELGRLNRLQWDHDHESVDYGDDR
jgi:hypothetical protein